MNEYKTKLLKNSYGQLNDAHSSKCYALCWRCSIIPYAALYLQNDMTNSTFTIEYTTKYHKETMEAWKQRMKKKN